jgi:hypothetical protein
VNLQNARCNNKESYGLATSLGLLGDAQFQSFLTFRIRLTRVFWGCNLPNLRALASGPSTCMDAAAKEAPLSPSGNPKLHNHRGQQFLKKPTAAQPFKTFYTTRRSITTLTKACQWTLSSARQIQCTPFSSHFFSTILRSLPRSSKWSLSLRF